MNPPLVLELVRGPGKTSGAIRFALNFLWLLSLLQGKESDKASINGMLNISSANPETYEYVRAGYEMPKLVTKKTTIIPISISQ